VAAPPASAIDELTNRLDEIERENTGIRQAWGTIRYEDVGRVTQEVVDSRLHDPVELALLPSGFGSGADTFLAGVASTANTSNASDDTASALQLAARTAMRRTHRVHCDDTHARTSGLDAGSVNRDPLSGGGDGGDGDDGGGSCKGDHIGTNGGGAINWDVGRDSALYRPETRGYIRVTNNDAVVDSSVVENNPDTYAQPMAFAHGSFGRLPHVNVGDARTITATKSAAAVLASSALTHTPNASVLLAAEGLGATTPPARLLRVTADQVASIEMNARKFGKFSDATSITASSNAVDPWLMTEQISEQILDEMLLEVANELGSNLDAMVDGLVQGELATE
jgi:hypothetical protein